MNFLKFIHGYGPPNLRFPNTKADIISRSVRSEKSKGWGYQNKLSSLIWFLELSQHYSTAEYHDYTENRLQWRHNEHDSAWNHQPRDCLLNRLFRRRSKRTWKLRVTCLCVGNSLGPVNSPHKWPSNAEKVSIWWRHHDRRNCGLPLWLYSATCMMTTLVFHYIYCRCLCS